ncbi:MAG TPA: OmpH family outer membrane protein [Bacteroidia bacterium]|nr:OmpH family outer membrane protein [Bacteroidia bacterium]
MKEKLSLALNAILIVAVIILFYLHFSSRAAIADVKKVQDSSATSLTFRIPKNLAGARVLYVNIDSISTKYKAFADLSSSEGTKIDTKMQQYQRRAMALQQRMNDLNTKAQNNLISGDDAQKEQDAIDKEQKALNAMEIEINDMQTKAQEKNQVITEEVFKYFNQYSREKKIDFILAYGAGSPIIYANDSLDVTNDVVDALNANYDANQKNNPMPLAPKGN